ncbi:hypothetical protein VTN49DRAFT_5206 [Thermomyces lanuginosus]|uniref:uncharacterized protein n=1 Tax=Thermomyces lanuginosus TaxID=5541 RepID=UPI003743C0A4
MQICSPCQYLPHRDLSVVIAVRIDGRSLAGQPPQPSACAPEALMQTKFWAEKTSRTSLKLARLGHCPFLVGTGAD